MQFTRKLGRKPAVADPRIPFLHTLASAEALPAPPAWANWYAGVGEHSMLGNDIAGDCVEAMAGNAIQQFACYADRDILPTAAEALALYSAITGYNPTIPDTDQGTVVLGPTGLVQHWLTAGVTFGGVKSTLDAVAQVAITPDLIMLRQAIHFFGGVGLGINLPARLIKDPDVVYMWDDATGPSAGGHEVWLCGYDESVAGVRYFDLLSWSEMYRMTADFLLATAEEAAAFYDPGSLNARGVNGDGFDDAQLRAAMAAIKAAPS